jgi:hypothetical protein
MNRNPQLIVRLLRFGLPASLVLLLLIPLYGYVRPWREATSALLLQPDQAPVLIAASYNIKYTNSRSTRRISQSYVLLPFSLFQPKSITVTQVNNEPLQVRESRYGALTYLGWLLITSVGSWWFWLRSSAIQQRA